MGWIKQSGDSIKTQLNLGTPTSTTVVASISISGGNLINWDLEQSEDNGITWSLVSSGISAYSQTAADLTPETNYKFRATARVSIEGTAVSTTTTKPRPPISLTSWAQIDGGQDFGSVINGGSAWFWNNEGPATFEVWFTNKETSTVTAIQLPVESISDNPGSMLGYSIQRNGVYQTDTTIVTPSSGATWDSPNVALSPIMVLNSPIGNGESARFQQLLSSGFQTPGKNFGDQYHPETSTTQYANFELGNHLGTDITPVGIAIGPFPTRMFLRLQNTELYTLGMFGDSTVAMVQPVDSPTTNSKEGIWFWANSANRTIGKNVRAYSYGQGTAQWSSIQARVRANLSTMQGKISRVCIQVWTWNSAYGNAQQAHDAWNQYLDLESEVKALGFACSPMILHPYTTKTEAGQIEGFLTIKDHVIAHGEGLVLDSITASSSWPNLPAEESEDNVHQNQSGSKRCANEVATKLRELAAIDYPEFY